MKSILFRAFAFLFLITLCTPAFSQADSTEDDRGVKQIQIFKTYEEYVTNTPSATADLHLKYIRASRKDTTIIAAKPGSGEFDRKIWGFSDGENTFVKFMGSVIGHRFWKLQCSGPNPYIFYKQKTLLATGGGMTALATLAVSSAVPATYTLMIVTKAGKLKAANKGNISRVLADSPQHMDDLKKASPLNQREKVRLIRAYNEAK